MIYFIINKGSMSAITKFVPFVSLWILLSYDEDEVANCVLELSPLTKTRRQLLCYERIR